MQELLDAVAVESGSKVSRKSDEFGFEWLVVHDGDFEDLVTTVHLVASELQSRGFGPQLLCTLVSFAGDSGKRLGLVYLYKRGTFYPFAPLDNERRDNALELQVRGAVGADLKIETDLSRWFPVWGAPGL